MPDEVMPIDNVVSFIEDETWITEDGHRGAHSIRDDGIDLWLPIDGARLFWTLFSRVSRQEGVGINALKVNPNGVRGTEYRMYARVGSKTSSYVKQPPRPLQEYVETAQAYHKFTEDEFTPQKCLNQCNDINKAIREGLRFEYREAFTLASGAVFNPMTNHGQAHMFIVIPSRYISDRGETIFLDGAALQFADRCGDCPQSLGSKETIDRVHVVDSAHEHRPYYTRNDDWIETDYAYED